MTAITFPNNPNTDPGVGGQYTAENGLVYVWDGEKWESLGSNNADPNNFVAVSGDNMTGDLTLGTDKITLNATTGFSAFNNTDKTVFIEPSVPRIYTANTTSTANSTIYPDGMLIETGNTNPNNTQTAFQVRDGQASTIRARIAQDGSSLFNAGTSDASGIYIFKNNSNAAYPSLFLEQANPNGNLITGKNGFSGVNTFRVGADGSASFAGDVNITVTDVEALYIRNNSNVRTFALQNLGSGPLLQGYNAADKTIEIGSDGSAEFAAQVVAEGIETRVGASNTSAMTVRNGDAAGSPITVQVLKDGGMYLGGTIPGAPNITLNGTNGSADFKGSVTAPGLFFNLEPDNDDNYTVTTEEYTETETYTGPLGNTLEREVTKTRDIRTYTGPTLDVKAVIQELQQRVAARDAVIADFTARLAALEADHAVLMGNNNGGY